MLILPGGKSFSFDAETILGCDKGRLETLRLFTVVVYIVGRTKVQKINERVTYRQRTLHTGVGNFHYVVVQQAAIHPLGPHRPVRILRGDVHRVGRLAAVAVHLEP